MSVAGRGLRRARDFQVLSYSGSGRASGRLHRLLTGCSSEEFAGLRTDEVPLVSRGECFFREKAFNAERAGARALVVTDISPTRRGVPSGTLAAPGLHIPVVSHRLRDPPAPPCAWTWMRSPSAGSRTT